MLQKLRERVSARLAGERESGFTLIELLVVMLIIGLLAAIALPSFFNQKEKAGDAKAKEYAHTAQVAMETYSTDNNGVYTGVTLSALIAIEPSLNSADLPTVTSSAPDSYRIVSRNPSKTSQTFEVVNSGGTVSFPCTTAGEGGCPTGGTWGG